MGQPAQPQPQAEFPFFLFFIILTTIAATTAIRTAHIMIVAMFSVIQANIFIPPVHIVYFVTLTLLVSAGASQPRLMNSMYTIPARTPSAAIRPTIFRFPVNTEPN